jgi:NADPH2:quinone reductase
MILFHAAAGGVGQIACQWARHLGATVIGTTSSPAKIELAKANGCTHVILSSDPDWPKKVRALSGGSGLPVVYDSVGKDTFEGSLDCLRVRGLMVSFGNASGPVTAFSPAILAAKGSLYLTRPTLGHYVQSRDELQQTADDLFAVLLSGAVKVAVGQRFALKDAAKAQEALAAKRTTGATVLVP